MSVVDDVRKLLQDFVSPEVRALGVKIDAVESASKLRDENLSAKIDAIDAASKLRDDGNEAASKLRDDNLSAKIDNIDIASKLRDDNLSAKIDSKFELLMATLAANQAAILNELNIHKRVEALERDKHTAAAQ